MSFKEINKRLVNHRVRNNDVTYNCKHCNLTEETRKLCNNGYNKNYCPKNKENYGKVTKIRRYWGLFMEYCVADNKLLVRISKYDFIAFRLDLSAEWRKSKILNTRKFSLFTPFG